MQRICRLICKICRICKKICKKICTKYDTKYTTNMQNMQKNMQNMSDHKTFQVYHKICKICNKYAKYVGQNLICRICTPHFADGSSQHMIHIYRDRLLQGSYISCVLYASAKLIHASISITNIYILCQVESLSLAFAVRRRDCPDPGPGPDVVLVTVAVTEQPEGGASHGSGMNHISNELRL